MAIIQTSKQLPTFTDLEQFLSNRVNAYEAGEIAIGSAVNDKYSKVKATKTASVQSAVTNMKYIDALSSRI